MLLPCDDPEWSNFTKYFAQNFERLGLEKLISTSFAVDSKIYKEGYQATLFEINDPLYDQSKSTKNGKIFTLTHDKTGDTGPYQAKQNNVTELVPVLTFRETIMSIAFNINTDDATINKLNNGLVAMKAEAGFISGIESNYK